MKNLFDDVTIVGLADDYRFVGPVDAAMDAAAMYKTEVEAAGHVFQGSKSWLFSRSCRTLRQAMQHPLQTVSAETVYVTRERPVLSRMGT